MIAESIKVVDFDDLFLTAYFCTGKRDFWPKSTIPEKFYIFWESEGSHKNFAIIFDGIDTRKKRFHLVGDFFRAQLYLTKVCLRDLKYGSVEAGMVDGHNKAGLSFLVRPIGAEIF